MKDSEVQAYSLIELIVVLIITAILAQIGFVAFNRYTRKTRAFAAKTAINNIKKECETNRDLGLDSIFTLLEPKGYGINSRNTNSCLGEIGSGLISAVPNISNDYPSYFYDFDSGDISCDYQNSKDTLFKECINLPPNTSEKFGPDSGLSCREVKAYSLNFKSNQVYTSGRSVVDNYPIWPSRISVGSKSWDIRTSSVLMADWWGNNTKWHSSDRPSISRTTWLEDFAKKAESVINESEGEFSAEIDPNNPGSIKIYSPKGTPQKDISMKLLDFYYGSTNPYAKPGLQTNDDDEGKTTTVCDGR